MSETIVRLKPARMDPEEMAVHAFNYLAIDPGRIELFLRHTGIEPTAIRQAAEMPGFLLGVLDYVAANEWLVLGLADHLDVRPEAIMHARHALAPPRDFD